MSQRDKGQVKGTKTEARGKERRGREQRRGEKRYNGGGAFVQGGNIGLDREEADGCGT